MRTWAVLILLLWAIPGAAETRTYHRVLVKDVTETIHTHICTHGVVALVRREADGDIHIRIEDGDGSTAFIVGEIIPTLLPKAKGAIRVPKVGEWVEICGISRWDAKHKWPEIHPVEKLK